MTVTIYRDDAASAIFVEDNNGAQFLNNLHAVTDDPTDTVFKIRDKSRDNLMLSNLSATDVVNENGDIYGADVQTVVNALNTLFSASGDPSGVAPSITSPLTVNLTRGQTLNYELTATGGVGYEWENLPSGITTVEGNVRKLIGGSNLATGTYPITASAINYFGADQETISLVVADPPYSNTKSVRFQNQDYMGANAALLDGALGRSSNGSGSGDAWTISMWYKASTDNQGQTILYFGANDIVNAGYIELRQVNATGGKRLRLRYGRNSNYLQLSTPTGSLTPGTWQHIMVTYDGGTTGVSSNLMSTYFSRFTIRIDDTVQSVSTSHANFGYADSISGQNFRLGRLVSGNSMRQAYVDELAIWGSDQESNHAAIYNSGDTHDLSALTNPPDHWWRMGDEDTYPTIQDNIGNAHFVMYNMTAADIVTDAP